MKYVNLRFWHKQWVATGECLPVKSGQWETRTQDELYSLTGLELTYPGPGLTWWVSAVFAGTCTATTTHNETALLANRDQLPVIPVTLTLELYFFAGQMPLSFACLLSDRIRWRQDKAAGCGWPAFFAQMSDVRRNLFSHWDPGWFRGGGQNRFKS